MPTWNMYHSLAFAKSVFGFGQYLVCGDGNFVISSGCAGGRETFIPQACDKNVWRSSEHQEILSPMCPPNIWLQSPIDILFIGQIVAPICDCAHLHV